MKKFSTSINGYNKYEVNSFVNDVTKEYESMLNNLKAKDTEISLLKEQLAKYQNLESTLNKTILLAEDSSSQMKKVAKNEADMIISDAKKNASHIVNDALIRAGKIEADADKLQRSLTLYKTKIKQTIEEQLKIVDEIDSIEFEDK